MKSCFSEETVVRLGRVLKLVNLVSKELIKVIFPATLRLQTDVSSVSPSSEWFTRLVSFRDHEERSNKIRKATRQTRLFQGFPVYTSLPIFFQVALESSLTEERKRGRQYAEEVKEQTKMEMLKYLAEKQEVKNDNNQFELLMTTLWQLSSYNSKSDNVEPW